MLAVVVSTAGTAAATPRLEVESGKFRLIGAGRSLGSEDLVGATLETEMGGLPLLVRIDGVAPAGERPSVLLHRFSVQSADGSWNPLCEADAQGRQMGFPVAGRWNGRKFVADPNVFFLACTSGAQGKCLLWGYDPWRPPVNGIAMSRLYQACQQMVRADYLGEGRARTRDGTAIDIADVAGVQVFESLASGGFAFEAGWDEEGAVCVARPRWPELAPRQDLIAARPVLEGPCDAATASDRGALIFTRVRAR